ncbi:ribosome biogenesis factor YjgA [Halochromatium glycolicum]|nr:ribosome biogenesis factor YjgA [Halochromatium glycolicum]
MPMPVGPTEPDWLESAADASSEPEDESRLPVADDRPSRSQIKREHQALQALAEQLAGLPRAELEALSFGETTWAALDETARIKDQRALRRHYKRIANCLAREDTEPLEALLAQRESQAQAAAARQHEVERWRQRLIEGGDEVLTELIDAYPAVDRQQLRSLVRAARKDTERGRPEAPRRLLRYLRGLLEASARKD